MTKDAVVALNRLSTLPMLEFYKGQLKDFEEQEIERFARSGPGWQPLSPRYSEWKAARYGSRGILRASDRLYKSLTEVTADSIRKATETGMQFGTRVPYANRHNKGTAGMPQREFLRFDLERSRAALRKFLEEKVNA